MFIKSSFSLDMWPSLTAMADNYTKISIIIIGNTKCNDGVNEDWSGDNGLFCYTDWPRMTRIENDVIRVDERPSFAAVDLKIKTKSPSHWPINAYRPTAKWTILLVYIYISGNCILKKTVPKMTWFIPFNILVDMRSATCLKKSAKQRQYFT